MSPAVWGSIGALILVVAAWPLAQRMRHPRVQPVAAWAIFLAVFAMVGGACLTLAGYLFGLSDLSAPSPPLAVTGGALLVIVPGVLAARWAISREPRRRKVEPD